MQASIKKNKGFIISLLAYHFAACVSNDIYIPSMPHLRDVFHASLSNVQDSMTAWYVGLCLPLLFLGPIADRLGRRPVLLIGCVVFIMASAGCMLAQTIMQFTAFRFIQGLCVASLNIACFSTIRSYFSYQDSVKLFAWMSIVSSSAPILGPILGGYFVTFITWRVDFLFLMIITAPACVTLFHKMPETKPMPREEGDSVFLTYCKVMRNPLFLANSLGCGLIHGCLILYLTSAPYVLIDLLGFSPSHFGFVQCPIFIAGMIGGAIVSIYAERFGISRTKHMGIALATLSLASMFMANFYIQENSVYLFIPFIMFFALGLGLCRSIFTADAMASLKTGIGEGSAVFSLLTALSATAASWLVGIYYQGHIADVARLLVLMNIAGLICYLIPKLKGVRPPLINS